MEPKINIYHASQKDGYIEIINQGNFNSYFTVDYSHDNTNYSFKSKTLDTGSLDKIMLCGGGVNIHVVVYIITSSGDLNIYDKTFATTTILKLLLSGTESSPIYKDVTNLSSPNDSTEFYSYYVSVLNTANYTAKLTVKYTINNKNYTISKEKILINHTQIIPLPTMAQNIQVSVNAKDKVTNWKSIYSKTLNSPTIFKLSLSGTITDPIVTDISSQLSTGTLPNLSNNSISVINSGGFVAQFYVTYSMPDTTNAITTNSFSQGETQSIIIPVDATNIDLAVNIMYTDNSWINIYQDFFSTSTALKLQLSGTLSAPVVTDITHNPNLGDPPPVTPPTVTLTKHPDKPMVMLGQEVLFTLNIADTDGEDATNLILKDILPAEASLVPNSLIVNGLIATDVLFSDSGINLGDMSIGDSHLITYKIMFNSIPSQNAVQDNPILSYSYIDADGTVKTNSLTGVTTPLMVVQNNCCCCPCSCNCPSQEDSYVDYFDSI